MSFRENQGNRFSGEYRPYRGRGGFRGRGRGGGDYNGGSDFRRRSPSPGDPGNGFRRGGGGGGGNRYGGGAGGTGGGFVSRRRSYSPRPQNDMGESASYRPRGSRGGGRGFFRGGDRGGYATQREYRRPYDDVPHHPQGGRGNGHFRSQGTIYRSDREEFEDGRNGSARGRRRQYSPGPMGMMRNGSPPPFKFERREFMPVPRERFSPPPVSHRMPTERSFEPRFARGGSRRYYSPDSSPRGGRGGGRGGGFRHEQSRGHPGFGGPRSAPRFEGDRRRGPPQDMPPRFDRNSDGGPPPFKRSRPGPGGPYMNKRRGASPVSP